MIDRTAEDINQDRALNKVDDRVATLEREIEILRNNLIAHEHVLEQLSPLLKLAAVADKLHKLGLK